MLGILQKLKGRTFVELAGRGLQRGRIQAERLGVSPDTKLASDAEFCKLLGLRPEATAEEIVDAVKNSNSPFFSSFDDRELTIRALGDRFPDEVNAIIERADRICSGRFDLLGYKDLYFGSRVPDWHFEPLSQKSSPMVHWSRIDEIATDETGDKKIVWELNRHQYFLLLGRAYWLTNDEKYAECFVEHIDDWAAKNPPKIGINWMSSLEIAFRSISWLWSLQFFKDSPKLTAAVYLKMLKIMYLNGRHLETYLSTYSSPNTHLTGEALGLYYLGTMLPVFKESKRWKGLGYKILMDALDFQVRDDGVYCEQSTHYHRYTTDFYTSLLILRQAKGLPIDQDHRRNLKRLLEFLMFITQPDGETPLIGDDDGGRLHFLDERRFADFRATLAVGAVIFDDPELKFAAGSPSAELLWLLGADGLRKFDELESAMPATERAFESGGFFAMRDTWSSRSNFLLVDCGPHGFLRGGHAHADALHFVLSVGGLPVFIDSGTYNYTSDAVSREAFRSTAAHNCLTVNGASSSAPAGPFSWSDRAEARLLDWKRRDEGVYFSGTHDGFERFGVGYKRTIGYCRSGQMIVTDEVESRSTNLYELNFNLSRYVQAEFGGGSSIVISAKDGNWRLLSIDNSLITEEVCEKGDWRIEDIWVSPRYGERIETTRLIYRIKAAGSFKVITTLTSRCGTI